MTLTSHVDVSGAAHVSPRENDEIQDVADDAEATNGRHHDTVTDSSQGRRSRILHGFRQQADIPNVAYIEHVHHLVVLSSASITTRDKFAYAASTSSESFARPACAHFAISSSERRSLV